MKNTRENRLELWVLFFFTFYAIPEIFTDIFSRNKHMYVVAGMQMILFFALTCKKHSPTDQQFKYKAIQYSVIFMIALASVLMAIETFTGRSLNMNGLHILFLGIAAQSIYYLFISSKTVKEIEKQTIN